MQKILFSLLVSGFLGFVSCNKSQFPGTGSYKARVQVEGGYVNMVRLEYWDEKYNNHTITDIHVPEKSNSFTTEEYKVGKAINVDVLALAPPNDGSAPRPKVSLVVELLKDGKVVRKGEHTGNGGAHVLLQAPLPKK